MVYRQTLEIKNIWFKVIATLILSIIFMSFSFLNIFPVFPIQVSAVLFWAVSICFLTFYIGYLIRYHSEKWYYQNSELVLCRLFHKKVKVNISDIKELVIGESYIYSRYGRIYLNTVYVENGKKKKIKYPWVSILMTPKVENLNDAKDYDILVEAKQKQTWGFSMYDMERMKTLLKEFTGNIYISDSINESAKPLISELKDYCNSVKLKCVNF